MRRRALISAIKRGQRIVLIAMRLRWHLVAPRAGLEGDGLLGLAQKYLKVQPGDVLHPSRRNVLMGKNRNGERITRIVRRFTMSGA